MRGPAPSLLVSLPQGADTPMALGLLLALLALAALLVLLRMRRGARSLPRLLARTNLAAERQRFDEALRWNRRAQKLASDDARLKADEGYFLSRLGDVDGALAAYTDASRRSTEGEADYLAALLLLQTRRSLDEAETHAVRALQRTPSLALDIEDDETFEPLRGRPAFEDALREAADRGR